jgi:glucokinase
MKILNSKRTVVAGDIGGTHMRFAIVDFDELRIDHYVQFLCSDFSSIEQGLAAYLKSVPTYPRRVSLAVAGPVDRDIVCMPNLPWETSVGEIRSVAQTDDVILLNDFEALALSLPFLSEHDLCRLGEEGHARGACRAVVGPGTGLGVAAVTSSGKSWSAIAGEGGHMTFAPQSRDEFEIFERLKFDSHHISYEQVLSGKGIVNLYNVLHQLSGKTAPTHTAAQILAAGHSGEDEIAVQTIDYFVTWLGRFAGDVALVLGARCGVYLAGGIPPNILEDLKQDGFRTAFESKGRLSSYVADIPVFVIKAADAGLRGAAVAFAKRNQ